MPMKYTKIGSTLKKNNLNPHYKAKLIYQSVINSFIHSRKLKSKETDYLLLPNNKLNERPTVDGLKERINFHEDSFESASPLFQPL
jgi:hypothetical protein